MSSDHVYVGKDLEAMSFAENYHKWILEEFRPYLGKRLVEVGAGTGLFTRLLLGESPEALVAVEPSEMFLKLEEDLSGRDGLQLLRGTFQAVRDRFDLEQKPDSIIYVNVLEHIEDDAGELRAVYETLPDGGRCFIFVPALMSLYGRFDEKIGHFRRYSKRELERKCEEAGFAVSRSRYFDISGIIPWYVKYKLLGSDSLEGRAVEMYDRLAVPVVKHLEGVVTPPIGKNILLIAEKRS